MPNLLIVDDDRELQKLLADYLGEAGFQCKAALDAQGGLALLEKGPWDAVILDIMLPGMSGLDILRRIRENGATRSVPVLMLTARGDEVDRVVGLDMGADDYLTKPFSARELVARINALIRRSMRQDDAFGLHAVGDIVINRSSLSVSVGGNRLELTVPEMRLLEMLVAEPGRPVERNLLSNTLFGHPAYPHDRSLDMLVSRLRKRLGPRHDGGERIKAVRGEGYVYILPGDA